MDKAKAREQGLTWGLVVLALLWAVIFGLYGLLKRPLGEDLAWWLSLVAALIASAVVAPVQNKYAARELKRYCEKHGHMLKNEVAKNGQHFVMCTRCYSVMINEGAPNVHPNP